MTVVTERNRITEALDENPTLDARHLTWQIAHLLKVHGYLDDPQQAMSEDQLPCLELVVDGRTFTVRVEEW